MQFNFTESDLEYFNPEEYFTYAGNFNSYTDLGLVVGKMSKPIMPAVQPSTQDVPGMYGNIFMGNDYGELRFTIPVTLMAFDRTSFNLICENLRAMFTADSRDPGVEYPIVFHDRPEIKYYGHWGQMSDPVFLNQTSWEARATLTFICSQPYGYMAQEDVDLQYPNQPLNPSGNATTYPIYTLYLKRDVYNVGFTDSHGGYVATGYTVDNMDTNDEGQQINDKMPLIENDPETNLDDWRKGKDGQPFDIDGDQAGQMGNRDGGGITPAYVTHTDYNVQPAKSSQVLNYGNPQPPDKNKKPVPRTNFYGPLVTHPQFSSVSNNWQLMVNLWNQKSHTSASAERAMGHNDIYLLDENGQRRGRIWIHNWKYGQMPRVGFCLGTGKVLNRDKDGNVTKIDEVDLINGNSGDSNSSTGPKMVDGGYFGQVNRPHQRVTINSLYDYKVTVAQSKKAKTQAANYKNTRTRKRNAAARATRKKRSSGKGRGRRVPHHYPKSRKSSKGKYHRRKGKR